MMTLSVLLFTKPAKELGRENEPNTHDGIASLGITIGARLSRIAAAVRHLEAEGFEPVLRQCDGRGVDAPGRHIPGGDDSDVDAPGLGLGRIPRGRE
jgi:hypothetical protein